MRITSKSVSLWPLAHGHRGCMSYAEITHGEHESAATFKTVGFLITTLHCLMSDTYQTHYPVIGSHPAFLTLPFFGGFCHV